MKLLYFDGYLFWGGCGGGVAVVVNVTVYNFDASCLLWHKSLYMESSDIADDFYWNGADTH